jgi:tetratricopeptide (TPR) repeat protein
MGERNGVAVMLNHLARHTPGGGKRWKVRAEDFPQTSLLLVLAGFILVVILVLSFADLAHGKEKSPSEFARAVKLLEKGEKNLDLKALNEAQGIFERECTGADRDAMCEYYLARVHLAKYSYFTAVAPDDARAEAELKEAEHEGKRAVDRRPSDPLAHVLMGKVQFAKLTRSPVSGIAEAMVSESPVLTEFNRALALDPNCGEAELGLGIYYQFMPQFAGGDPHLARTHFRRAAELMPNNPEPLVWLAASYREEGRLAEARQYLNRAMELDPNNRFVLAEAQRLVEAERSQGGA